jgi:hypothetical protein
MPEGEIGAIWWRLALITPGFMVGVVQAPYESKGSWRPQMN